MHSDVGRTRRRRLSTRERRALFEKHNETCHICTGKILPGQSWEVSHPIPLELGGADDESNRAPAHFKCHKIQTAEIDIPAIAKAKRREARHRGFRAPSARPMPGSKNTRLRKKFNGQVERRW